MSGNGQRELAEAIFGLRRIESGDIAIRGETWPRAPRVGALSGLAYVPEERMRDGAIGDFTLPRTSCSSTTSRSRMREGVSSLPADQAPCTDLVERYTVKTPHIHTPTRHLSGGNIQKVVIAREFSCDAEVLVVAQPTRGVDIGAAEYIHERLLEQRRNDAAILLISEDLDEVMQLSDRIIVLLEGEIMGEVQREDFDVQRIGLWMSGVRDDIPA